MDILEFKVQWPLKTCFVMNQRRPTGAGQSDGLGESVALPAVRLKKHLAEAAKQAQPFWETRADGQGDTNEVRASSVWARKKQCMFLLI